MTNPIFRVKKTVPTPTGGEAEVVEEKEIDLSSNQYELGKSIGFLVGFCEGLLSFLPCESFPIDIANYDQLDEYEQMRSRELLVVAAANIDGSAVSDVSKQRIKLKLELDHTPPRVLVYRMEI